jgi:GNAT superfamily N-acetyltransferase
VAAALSGSEPLTNDHDVESFDCGRDSITTWLRDYALASQRGESARVYVVHRAGRVVGYYALAAASVEKAEAPTRVGRGLPSQSIPVVLLARLGVDTTEQGTGLGRALVKDALLRTARAADQIGARALLVHALDEDVIPFYEQWDFERSPTNPLHLFLLMKDLRAITAG